ncbi:hypothetical protein GXP67_07375 [Rhodocytophaga rosea]|uniref:Uncharacterized protein n=1 Tax=Rhodocytophaga rosea TaxID=2704465 RepID=A0A6C0GEQ3_9BACT|nr:hypothetical protein [Rhodocytophaga rosea]QHT66489.1 hypothetical protein GXP67_07375 [Rhodocytophaga rosea]
MGYDVLIVAKTREDDKLFRILTCEEGKGDYFLSRNFSMFQSRNFEGCELIQVEQILEIDLSLYWNYPTNYMPDIGELNYRMYQAEQAGDFKKAIEIKQKIEEVEREWHRNYYLINEGWTKIEDLRQITLKLIEKIKSNPAFGKQIKVAPGWDYPWGKYFTLQAKKHPREARILEDLDRILQSLDCIEREGEQYVAFIGG